MKMPSTGRNFLSCANTFSMGGFRPRVRDRLQGKPLALEYIEAPARIEVSLSQHRGPAAQALVDIGAQVRAGQLIGQAPGSRVHAPIDGIVTAIKNRLLASGLQAESMVIEHEPAAESGRQSMGTGARGEILERIAQAGIVGMGGGTFPTASKLRLERGCDYLLLNAAECEPYLHSDACLLQEMAFEVMGGIAALAEVLRPGRIVIGLGQSKARLLGQLQAAIEPYRSLPVQIARLKSRYPQGAEQQLVQAISGRETAPGQLPQDMGCIVVNVATCKAIYDAVEYGQPLIRRIVTVNGAAVRQPKVFSAPLGTALGELLERCGGLQRPVARMIRGGPLMGTAFYDWQQFVTKGSSGFLFLTDSEVRRGTERPCIHCNVCIQVCPMGLEPAAMYRQILAENPANAIGMGLWNCIECGACASVCPSRIPLTQGFRVGKLRSRQI